MTKQKAIISLHLAKWLGYKRADFWEVRNCAVGGVVVCDALDGGELFNPFAATTEGRAQFAECLEKVGELGWAVSYTPTHTTIFALEDADGFRPALAFSENKSCKENTLGAIYLATGGQPGKWEES